MIKIEGFTYPSPEQILFAIEGMRNPMNSWDKSDSRIDYTSVFVGDSDYELMVRLAKAGKDHRKYLRMLPVGMRITAPLYWWKEFDTYKIGTVANSCSTMHKISAKEFTLEDFSHEHLTSDARRCLEETIKVLNEYREYYIDSKNKEYWWQMIQLLPSSYNQTRNVTLNYEVLNNIYHARKDHKLDEWREFCDYITHRMPVSPLIVIGD